MALTALDIYKLLPKTNCKECGQPTCLAFAMQMASGKATLDRCPYASEEAVAKLGAAAAPPLPKVTVGTGEAEVVLGDETVLFRHEKTFHHPAAIAISARDDLADDAFAERLLAIRRLSFTRVGQRISVDLVALRYTSGDPARYALAAARAREATGLPVVLIASTDALSGAVEAIGDSRPLLSPPPSDLASAARLAAERKLPLRVRAKGIGGVEAALAAARAAGAASLVADTAPGTVLEAVADATAIRRLAILERNRDLAYPSAFDLGESFPDPFAAAALLIPKYGSLLVLDAADPAETLPLLTLRQNIFTDPQRPIQVEPGTYPIGAPTEASPVVVTTNFSLTYFTVRGDTEASKTPAWLLIADCDGMSVLTAWAAGKFTGESIAKILSEGGIAEKVSHRTLIIPGMVARLSGRIEELSAWRVLVGPQESSALPSYLRRLPPAAFVPVHA
ncbi:MAG: acetyl-CoA decarbonylase/synthase complex subunit gamma [Deltaproteobacteria bacterium]|nr:MAG: acetyl-CoA decarbonylase/synthase complex subunit gamma [Deltaproteobacteria bacterium]